MGAYSAYQRANGARITTEGLVGAALLGALFGILPDEIEPATSPRHRKTAHSMALLALCLGELTRNDRPDEQGRLAAKIAAAGVGSHILADSTTDAGIPLI